MTSSEFQTRLRARLVRVGISLEAALGERLEVYYHLLATWNAKTNLTALKLSDPTPETLDRLLVEPLIAAALVTPSALRVIDIGTGGGSPAIPLVLAAPQLRLLMVESKARKSVFLREAARAVGLLGAEVETARFEELAGRPALYERHQLLTLRGVRVDTEELRLLQHLVAPGGQLFLFRGGSLDDAGVAVESPLRQAAVHPLTGDRSQLVVLDKLARHA